MQQGMRARRGFTLIEILVTLAILGVLMAGVASVVIAQSRSYELNARTRDVVAANRTSVTYLETRLRMAGFGVDPQNALDFGSAASPITRDRTNGPDELVFFARDAGFHRRLTGYSRTSTSLSLATSLTSPLYPGQVLLVTCPSGVGAGYVTVSTKATGDTVELMGAQAGNPFPRQAMPDCGVEQPFILKVDRYRFFVADVNDGGRIRPYLLLDQGLKMDGSSRAYDATQLRMTEMRDTTPGDNTALPAADLLDLSPLAAGVEDFQVAYVMNRPEPGWLSPEPTAPDGTGGNWVLGDSSSDGTRQPNPAAVAPSYEDEYRNPNRFTAHPANVRGVRITLVTRSDNQAAGLNTRPAAENHSPSGSDRYYRNVISTQVYVRNLLSRSNFAPVQVEASSP